MATLQIEATPNETLKRYKLAIDNKRVKMGANNKGSCVVTGADGDGSPHKLGYTLFGPAGSKLTVNVLCDGVTQLTLPDIEIFPETEPLTGGLVEFQL